MFVIRLRYRRPTGLSTFHSAHSTVDQALRDLDRIVGGHIVYDFATKDYEFAIFEDLDNPLIVGRQVSTWRRGGALAYGAYPRRGS